MNHDQDYIREFVIECREGLDRIDTVLVSLEATPGERTGLDVVFRALHTIKGNAGFLDFPKLGAVAHAGESLLSKLFGGKMTVNAAIADVLLRVVDAIRSILVEVEATGQEGAANHDALIQELVAWTAAASSGGSPTPSSTEPASPPAAAAPAATAPMATAAAVTPPAPTSDETISLQADRPPSKADSTLMDETLFRDKNAPAAPGKVTPNPVPQPPAETAGSKTQEAQAAAATPTTAAPSAEAPAPKPDDSSVSAVTSRITSDPELSTFIRVQIDHLDDLMALVGELVLARNRIVQITSSREDDELTEPIQRLHRLTAALQDGLMRTRMQPVRNAWRKYPRIVRDLAKQCGKLCEVELHGGDTELDKSMLEAIADPLVHLVRNAIDHGIEKPYLRKIKGKPETGRLLVRAFQESGQVHIEVSDDGAGLDLERIRKKAVEVGMLTPERANQVSASELQNSVFLPGFTTTDKVTSLSGRGVGMDVVKTCVEQIGGTIELQTQKDVGTTIRLTVPLTLAIVPAIMVGCGRQRFAVPQINVVEMLRLRGDDQRQACDHFHDTPVLRLRGELLPMADLCDKLGIEPRSGKSTRETLDILVLKTGTRRFALLVDEIGDAQEIVVKPLGELLTNQTEYSGAALMGDGSIALILDVLGIARSSGLLTSDQTMLGDSVTVRTDVLGLEEQVLVCEIDGDRRIALPLLDVVCLEQIPFSLVEHSATGDVLQYRGEILPLHQLARHGPAAPSSTSVESPITEPTCVESQFLSVVVYRTAQSQLGLLVDRIVDVAPRPVELRPVDELSPVELARNPDARERVVATAVVLGRITDFLQVS